MEDVLLFEVRDRTAVITLNRPERRNAVDGAAARAMDECLNRIAGDDDILSAVLTGAGAGAGAGGGAFCSGMDLKEFLAGGGEDVFGGPGGFAGFVRRSVPKPMIAAVNGAALGGGLELVLSCDMVVAAESAVFGLPEVKVGLYPAAGGAFRLVRAISPAKALEMMLTGEPMSARQALDAGLVNRVVSGGEVLPAALELAARINAGGPLGVRAALALARSARRTDEELLWVMNEQMWQSVRQSADAAEGPAAFLEKRPPNWRGK